MKKLFKMLAFSLVVALSAGLFVGCGEDPTALQTNMITLSYTSVAYDGTEKTPEVTVTIDEEVVDAEEYTVEYSDNKKAGNAVVTITAVEDSDVISGSVSVGFVITQAAADVANITDLNAIMQDANYSEANVTENLIIAGNTTLTIPEGFTVNMGNNQLTIAASATLKIDGKLTSYKPIINGGTISGEGEYVAYVDSFEELNSALRNADEVILEADIAAADASGAYLNINAENTNFGVVLNLNGHTINKRVAIRNTEQIDFNITIKNGTINGGAEDYAITVHNRASSADKYVIRLEDLVSTSGETGLSTNGLAENDNTTIIATNCTFGSKAGEYGIAEGSVCGVYLPAKYNYKFNNCTFYGKTGYYTKSGTHNIVNCTIEGFKDTYTAPSYNGSGANETGSAFVADSAQGYQTPLVVTINGGTFKSVDGYAIEEVVTTNTAVENDYTTIDITGNPSLTSGAGKEGYKLITNQI